MKALKKVFLVTSLVLIFVILAGCEDSKEKTNKVIQQTTTDKNETSKETEQTTKVEETNQPTPQSTEESGKINVTINVYNKDKEKIYSKEIRTDETNLFEIVKNIDDLEFVTEESEGGKFVASILRIPYIGNPNGDSNIEACYWYEYKNGEICTDNILYCEIKNNDVIEFRLEKVG